MCCAQLLEGIYFLGFVNCLFVKDTLDTFTCLESFLILIMIFAYLLDSSNYVSNIFFKKSHGTALGRKKQDCCVFEASQGYIERLSSNKQTSHIFLNIF